MAEHCANACRSPEGGIDDLAEMSDRGCITDKAFIMTLVPESEPVVDKAHGI
jgi:hypothetical protein